MYVATFTYHPNIGTFRGNRGAWRVRQCWLRQTTGVPAVTVVGDELVMRVAKQLRPNTFVNPTRLLKEYFNHERSSTA